MMNEQPIYLDYMATTPVDPRVIEKMLRYLGPDGIFGNPSSTTHSYGKVAANAIDEARSQLAQVIQASPQELIFTSGATEANNLAIFGAARFYQRKGNHLITLATEHKSVLDCYHQLEREGFHVTYLKPQPDGLINLNHLVDALTDKTILVSVMHVNNEIGVIQNIAAITELLRDKGILFHVDAAQSAGKIPINLKQLSVDLMSFSAHKIYGPKGIGALYIRQKPRVRLLPQSFGGTQEQGLRAGTLATHQIVGLGEAFILAQATQNEEQTRILHQRERLWNSIKELPGIHLNGHKTQRIAGNLNLRFEGIEGNTLLYALRELAISTTSACASASMQPSYVLRALGLDDEQAYSSIRLSIGRFTTDVQIDKAIDVICKQITRLSKITP